MQKSAPDPRQALPSGLKRERRLSSSNPTAALIEISSEDWTSSSGLKSRAKSGISQGSSKLQVYSERTRVSVDSKPVTNTGARFAVPGSHGKAEKSNGAAAPGDERHSTGAPCGIDGDKSYVATTCCVKRGGRLLPVKFARSRSTDAKSKSNLSAFPGGM